MAQTPEQGIELSPEDNARMKRLYEEIAGRYAQMALIIGRTLGNKDLPAPVAPGGRITLVNKETEERASYLCSQVDGVPGEILPAGVALVDGKSDQKRQGLAILIRLYRYKQVEVGGEIN